MKHHKRKYGDITYGMGALDIILLIIGFIWLYPYLFRGIVERIIHLFD
ncbi:hypothetical protein [Clostridium autoethanogenum]|nr:hypothetical protein [Clostridium autoethanogenum]